MLTLGFFLGFCSLPGDLYASTSAGRRDLGLLGLLGLFNPACGGKPASQAATIRCHRA